MNENPAQPGDIRPIQPPEIPETAPHNPYHINAAMTDSASTSERQAKGLDGDALDSLLKSRMIEGMRIGYGDGQAVASRSYPRIYDDGWRVGTAEGHTAGYASVIQVAVPELEAAARRLESIMRATGSATIKETCQAGIDSIKSTFERL